VNVGKEIWEDHFVVEGAWYLVSVDFPGGPDWGFDRLRGLAGGPDSTTTIRQDEFLRAERCSLLGDQLATLVKPASDDPVVVIGSCAAYGLANDVASRLVQQGARASALGVDGERLDTDGLEREARHLLSEVRFGKRDGAQVTDGGLAPSAISADALDEWVDRVQSELAKASRDSEAMAGLSEDLIDQLLARYRAWLIYYGGCALAQATAGPPDYTSESSGAEDAVAEVLAKQSTG
jgi:hypothetical protein